MTRSKISSIIKDKKKPEVLKLSDRNEFIISKPQALQILNPYFPTFAEVIPTAFGTFISHCGKGLHIMSNGAKSFNIHDYIVNEAENRFADNDNVKILKVGLLHLAIVEECLFLKFKKFSHDLSTSNQPTEQVKRFYSQQLVYGEQPFLPGIVDEEFIVKESFANINIGYILNETSTGISSLHVTCPRNSKDYWWEHTFFANGVVNLYKEQEVPKSESSDEKRYSLDIPGHLKEGKTNEEKD